MTVVLSQEFLRGEHQLSSNQLVALLLEAGSDVRDEATIDTVRLDHDVSAFHFGGGCRGW